MVHFQKSYQDLHSLQKAGHWALHCQKGQSFQKVRQKEDLMVLQMEHLIDWERKLNPCPCQGTWSFPCLETWSFPCLETLFPFPAMIPKPLNSSS